MSTTAVTPEAPAVSTDTPNSNFLPEGNDYRLKGEMPSKKDASAAPEVKETPSPAAASEAATEQEKEKGPATTKTEATSESRWAKITRENKELREKLQSLETRQTTEQPREAKQAPQPATEVKGRTEPTLEDVDEKTGKPKYSTLAEFLADHSKWNREEAVREFQEMSTKQQREQQAAQTEQIIEKTVNERVQAARKTYPDYDEAVADVLSVKDDLGQDAFFFSKGSPIDIFFLDSDKGQDVIYTIAKNFDDHKHIFARDAQGNYLLNPVRQLRELAKIENSLGQSKPASVPKVTQAPPPPHQVSSKGTVAKDAVEEAVKAGDTEAYMREQNARALARRQKKG